MALKSVTNQRERDKFEEVNGKTVINVQTVGSRVGINNFPANLATSDKQDDIITALGGLVPTSGTNPSLTLSNADAVVASTKTLTMTIGVTSYTSTLSYNAAGDFLSMSVWS